jgi:MFS family permease
LYSSGEEATLIKNTKAITISSYVAMLFLGVGNALVGVAARNIGLSPFQIGLLITIQNIGFMVSVLISGALADRQPKPKILVVGSLILSAGFLTFYLSDLYWINILIMLAIGAGAGAYEGVTDAMLMDIHTERVSLHININHLFVTLGSALITIYFIFLEANWRASIIQAGFIVLLLALFFVLTKLPKKQLPPEGKTLKIGKLFQNRIVVVLFLVTIIAVGVEISTLGILTTFLMDLRQFSQATSKIGLIIHLAGVAAGRLIIGMITREEKLVEYLLSLLGAATLFYLGLFFLDLNGLNYLFVFLTGITLSAMLPFIITLAGLHFKDQAGTVIGIIKFAIPIGGILMPFLLSVVSRFANLQTALVIYPLGFLLAFGLVAVGLRGVNSQAITTQPEDAIY